MAGIARPRQGGDTITLDASEGCCLAIAVAGLAPSSALAAGSGVVPVTTWGGATGSGTDSFTPTGCDKLVFAPKVTATATRDASDAGARLVTTITQAGGEAAIAATTLTVPRSVLAPNLNSAGSIGSTAPIGTVTAQSPLLRAPLTGKAFLAGTASAPVISLRFAPPFGFTLDGAVSLAHDSVTFADLPDVPLTSLSLTLNGLFDASCVSAAGTVTAGFTGQNGAMAPSSTPLAVIGCPPTSRRSPSSSRRAREPRRCTRSR